MSLRCLSDSSVEYAFLTMVLDGGALDDGPGSAGLHHHLANSLVCGAGNRGREAFQEELDSLGADLSVRSGRKNLFIEGEVLSRNLEPLMELIASLLSSPHFDREELETQKRLALAELEQIRDSDEDLVSFLHGQFVWQGHPYARSIPGSAESVRGLEQAKVRGAFDAIRSRGIVALGAAGDVDSQTMNALVAEKFDLSFTALRPSTIAPLESSGWDGIEVLVVDRRDRTQAQILWGQPSCNANHEDGYALRVANTSFGGTFTSTLMQEIREKRGWTYGASSAILADRTTGLFAMNYHVENENALAAIQLGFHLFQEWRDNGITEEELGFSKNYIINSFPFSVETAQKRLEREMGNYLLGRTPAYLESYLDKIAAVDVDGVRKALAAHLSPTRMRLTVLGRADELEPGLSAMPEVGSVRVIEYDAPLGEVLL